MTYEDAKRRLGILSAELAAMEAEIDEQMKKYVVWPGWDTEPITEMEMKNDIKTATPLGEDVEGEMLRRFEGMGREILKKQEEVDAARREAISYELDEGSTVESTDSLELVLWHHNGHHYLRNKRDHVYSQKTGRWVGIYSEPDHRIDETAVEPEYNDSPPPLVALDYLEWTCDKKGLCECK